MSLASKHGTKPIFLQSKLTKIKVSGDFFPESLISIDPFKTALEYLSMMKKKLDPKFENE